MLPIRNVTYTKCYLYEMLSIRNVTYTKCYLYEMLPIQSVRYEMLPRRNVTIRKCTIRNVTDPLSRHGPVFNAQVTFFIFIKMFKIITIV